MAHLFAPIERSPMKAHGDTLAYCLGMKKNSLGRDYDGLLSELSAIRGSPHETH